MDCIVHGVAKSWTRLSDFLFTNTYKRKELKHTTKESYQTTKKKKEKKRGTTEMPDKYLTK